MNNQMDIDTEKREIEENYFNFLDDRETEAKYSGLIKAMVDEKRQRLIVNINDLRQKFPKRAAGLLNNAFEEQMLFQNALKKHVQNVDSEFAKNTIEFLIGFEGSLGSKHVTPRTLTSRYLGNLVSVKGIVTKCSLVRPKIVKSVHYCKATEKILQRFHTDLTSFDPIPASGVYPTKDEDGNPLETEYGLTVYKDHQTITVQELPEKSPVGQMPRSVDVILDHDLVDQCKPGDRVIVVGSFRCLPGKYAGYTSGTFRTIIIANNVATLSKEITFELQPVDVAKCKSFAKRGCGNKNIVDLLSRSLAPSIYGNEYVKKAILLLLLGGSEKVLQNGTRLRGDINVLLIGDPSVAKSQLLRYVLMTAPRAIATTGRGSSGVGLTAAVTADQETGERRLEAGAMVLADRGVICIDEFDKMTDIDRTAIHEVMEQGRVTIAKAGIHATLNARCSVLAAANPVYGRYDQFKSPMDNIGLQDSLLSRFDLLFVMLDKADPELDHVISDHVVRMHRYRNPLEQDGEPLPIHSSVDILSTKNLDEEDTAIVDSEIFEKYDPLLHGNLRSKSDKILTISFMRKYIQLAKYMKPELTDAACRAIASEYSMLRSQKMEATVARTQPITARSLETLIRLATAHAKARLSKKVTIEDANAAIELVQFAYFKRVLEKEKRRKRINNEDDEDEAENEDASNNTTTKRVRKTRGDPNYDEYDFDDNDDGHIDEAMSRMTELAQKDNEEKEMEVVQTPITITNERLELFQTHLNDLFNEKRANSLSISSIEEYINSKCADFSKDEIMAALQEMMAANKVMIADADVVLV